MPGRRAVSNPLALAVMGLLQEKPMHPYEMASELRERDMDTAFKLSTGTLYDTVQALARHGWIVPHAKDREGNRPQRTVYEHTGHGRTEFLDWLDEIIRVPAPEHPRFLSAVTYLGALGPDRAREALADRCERLRAEIERVRGLDEKARTEHGLPRLFMIEVEYHLHMREAELAWAERIAAEIRSGVLTWPDAPPGATGGGSGTGDGT